MSEAREAAGEQADPSHSNVSGRFSTLEDILEFDKKISDVTKGLPIRTGSILKVPSDQYGYWRIGLTDENQEDLARIASEFWLKDQREKDNDKSIGDEERTPFSTSIRTRMSRIIAYSVTQLLTSSDDGKKEFIVVDIASRLGQLSNAIATALRSDSRLAGVLNRTVFHLVDLSDEKLMRAKTSLTTFGPKAIKTFPMSDDEYFGELNERIDVAVSLCHLHKKPFPDIYDKIFESMGSGGALISGDWHSSLCDRPIMVYKLLEQIGVEQWRLDYFRQLFGDRLDPDSYPDMTEEEIKAVNDHQKHWVDVHHRLSHTSKTRHYILGAFDTTRRRISKLEDAGFLVDSTSIRKAFPNAKLPANPKSMTGDSDRASVITAIKGGK